MLTRVVGLIHGVKGVSIGGVGYDQGLDRFILFLDRGKTGKHERSVRAMRRYLRKGVVSGDGEFEGKLQGLYIAEELCL